MSKGLFFLFAIKIGIKCHTNQLPYISYQYIHDAVTYPDEKKI